MALITPRNIATSKLTDGSTFLTNTAGLPVANFPPNTIVKSITFRPSYSSELTVNANTDVEWWSTQFATIRANSRILITYHSGQIGMNHSSAQGNPRITWSVNSSSSGSNMDLIRDHNHEWYNTGGGSTDKRLFVTGQALTSQLSIGTHTIRAFAGAYNLSLVFFHQGSTTNRLPIITLQEIAT